MNENSPDKLTMDIKKNFENKTTEELLEIWKENNRGRYSDYTFDVIKLLLDERNVMIPEQNHFDPHSAQNQDHKLVSFPCIFNDNTFRTRFVQALLIISFFVWGLAVVTGIFEYKLLNDIKYGQFANEAEMKMVANISDLVRGLIGLCQILLVILTMIFFMMWVYRSNKNIRALTQEPMRFTPGWSVGWFFIPVAALWMPYQAMKEIWQVSSKYSSRHSGTIIVGWWWTFWIISGVLGQASFRIQMQAEELDGVILASSIGTAGDIFDIISKVFVFILVSKIFSMQEQIRGRYIQKPIDTLPESV